MPLLRPELGTRYWFLKPAAVSRAKRHCVPDCNAYCYKLYYAHAKMISHKRCFEVRVLFGIILKILKNYKRHKYHENKPDTQKQGSRGLL